MSGANLRKFILFDKNGREVELTAQSNVPVALKDANGLELALESNGGVPVNVQDQTTRPFDVRINQPDKTGLTIAAQPTVGSYDVTLSTGHGVIIGDILALFEDDVMPQLWYGDVLNVVGDVITLDTPCPYAFTVAGTVGETSLVNMNVDGSVTPEIYGIVNVFNVAVDIVRLIIHITDTTAMDDGKFGGQAALTNGVVFRKKISASQYINYWNVKTNGEIGGIAYDRRYDDKAPAGVYGMTTRLTYGGQSKHGVVIRLEPGEAIEMIIQDDLTGLSSFITTFEGHSILT
jgi:hypothetical protein